MGEHEHLPARGDLYQIAAALQSSNQALAGLVSKMQEQEKLIQNQNVRIDAQAKQNAATQFKVNHVHDPKDGFYGLSRLGLMFVPTIGPVYMGRFLRKVGLAKGSKYYEQPDGSTGTGCTLPTHIAYDRGMVDERSFASHTEIYWNAKKVIEFIDRWLERSGKMDDFTRHLSREERHHFINEL